jgi:hypothetical protein
LGTLRTGLHISAEQHAAILGRLEQDDSVNRIRHAVAWVLRGGEAAALRAGAAARALRAALKTCHCWHAQLTRRGAAPGTASTPAAAPSARGRRSITPRRPRPLPSGPCPPSPPHRSP